MKKYELCFIVNGSNTEDKAKDIAKEVEKTTVEQGAKIEKTFFWGKRKLAYPIQKENFGYYFLLVFESNSETIKKITKDLNLSGKVVRYLITEFLEETSFWEEEKEGGGKRKEFLLKEKEREKARKEPKRKEEKEEKKETTAKAEKEEEISKKEEKSSKEEDAKENEKKTEDIKEKVNDQDREKELEEKLAELLKEE